MRRDIAQALRQQTDRFPAGGLRLTGNRLPGIHTPIVNDGSDRQNALSAEDAVRRDKQNAGDVWLHRSDHTPQGAAVFFRELFHAVERAYRHNMQPRNIGQTLLQDLLNILYIFFLFHRFTPPCVLLCIAIFVPLREEFFHADFSRTKPVQQQRPQMYAAVEILQLDVCQLKSYISTALLENPTLECGAAPAVSLLDDLPAGRRGTGEDAEGLPQPDLADKDAVAYGEDLTTHLLFQAERLSLEPTTQRAVFAVIHALDPDGYLRADLSSFGPAPIFDAAVQIVQRLDPPGVGARTLSECLYLQLRVLGESGLPCRIAERYLEQAGHHAFAAIAASEQVPLAAVQEAYRQIQCLSPYPCAEFCRASDDSYVIPDVLIHEKDGVLSVSVNKAYTPELTVSSFYRSLGHESEDPEVRQYLAKRSRRRNGSSTASVSGSRHCCAVVRKF